jgi:hypothetical protein
MAVVAGRVGGLEGHLAVRLIPVPEDDPNPGTEAGIAILIQVGADDQGATLAQGLDFKGGEDVLSHG